MHRSATPSSSPWATTTTRRSRGPSSTASPTDRARRVGASISSSRSGRTRGPVGATPILPRAVRCRARAPRPVGRRRLHGISRERAAAVDGTTSERCHSPCSPGIPRGVTRRSTPTRTLRNGPRPLLPSIRGGLVAQQQTRTTTRRFVITPSGSRSAAPAPGRLVVGVGSFDPGSIVKGVDHFAALMRKDPSSFEYRRYSQDSHNSTVPDAFIDGLAMGVLGRCGWRPTASGPRRIQQRRLGRACPCVRRNQATLRRRRSLARISTDDPGKFSQRHGGSSSRSRALAPMSCRIAPSLCGDLVPLLRRFQRHTSASPTSCFDRQTRWVPVGSWTRRSPSRGEMRGRRSRAGWSGGSPSSTRQGGARARERGASIRVV